MACSVPPGIQRALHGGHDPQPVFRLATESAALDEQNLAFPVTVRIERNGSDLRPCRAEGHDRPAYLVRIDPLGGIGGWLRMGMIPSSHDENKLAEVNNILS